MTPQPFLAPTAFHSDPVGSTWRRWEPHIHTPGTLFNDQFGAGEAAWDEFLDAVEASDPPIEALGVTDYLGLDLYEHVRVAKAQDRLPGVKLIFPNIEMRFGIGTTKGSAINFHLLVSPEDPDHAAHVRDLLSRLTFRYGAEDYSCTRERLIRLGRAFDSTITDEGAALRAGAHQFKVNPDELTRLLAGSGWAKENILIGVVVGNNDGTAGLQKDASMAALRQQLERSANIIFASQPAQREFWLGRGKVSAAQLEETWGGRKPCLHGSDAHELEDVGRPDLDRYSWIKGDLTFESLRQACIEPERAFVGPQAPKGGLPSNIISAITVSEAPWLDKPQVDLNPGLVAVIGARGSGKTALVELIAAGAYSLASHTNRRSFVHRASRYLGETASALTWGDNSRTANELRFADMQGIFDEERVQYLSQQFVDQLCSSEGLTDELLAEIERVIFQAHPPEDRMAASDFRELLDLRAQRARNMRSREEETLIGVTSALIVERGKKDGLPGLEKQRGEKAAAVERDKADRQLLIGKGQEQRTARLEAINTAAEQARAKVDAASRRHAALLALRDEVADTRTNVIPTRLRRQVQEHAAAGLRPDQWEAFRLRFAGDVDEIIAAEISAEEAALRTLKGPAPGEAPLPGENLASAPPFVSDDADLSALPFSILSKEMSRLRAIVGVDVENRRRYSALSDKISRAVSDLERMDREIADARGAEDRLAELRKERGQAYQGVFAALLQEEAELAALYTPLKESLAAQTGALGKLSFSVRRRADVEAWAAAGEELLDLRKAGPLKGRGALLAAATADLKPVWETGSAQAVREAMGRFRSQYEQALVDHALVEKSDRAAYREWAGQVSAWLYGTDHIQIAYGVQYDGVEIEQLSPGTRGIVLLLLYLAIDQEDDRPLIIDQPEENLDPKSIFDELVHRFRAAKLRRQIIIVTHNANLVVNTDADQVIVATCGPHQPGQLPPISYVSGGLENPVIRGQVCEILEGGEAAFKERAKRLRVHLDG